jgi:peptidoglycan/LPS O-acetylase OafA/YrhL
MANEFKVNNFDLLRILAATQVLLAHTAWHLGLGRPFGWALLEAFPGVPIFFAISGFLISASFERTQDVPSYARNRALRIFPALWCVVILTVACAALFGIHFLHVRALFWFACQLAGLIFTPGFLRPFGIGSYNGALATIPIELQFYILLPLFYLGTTRTERGRTAVFLVAWVVFILITYLNALAYPPGLEHHGLPLSRRVFGYSFIPHIYMFLTGALLQRWNAHRSRWIAGKGLAWVAAHLVAHFAIPWPALQYVVDTLILAVATVSLAYTVPGLSERFLRGNDISYGVYIYHGLILNILIERGLKGRMVYLLLVMALAFAAGILSWRFVERPFLRRKRKAMHAIPAAAP